MTIAAKRWHYACSMGIAVALTGCATITQGSKQDVPVASTPSEAKVEVVDSAGRTIAEQKTPCVLSLKRGGGFFRKGEYTVRIGKQGYREQEIRLEGRVNGWYVGGNFVFGSLVGWLVVDPISGAMWSLNPTSLSTFLAEEHAALAPAGGDEGIRVILKEDVPAALLSCLSRID